MSLRWTCKSSRPGKPPGRQHSLLAPPVNQQARGHQKARWAGSRRVCVSVPYDTRECRLPVGSATKCIAFPWQFAKVTLCVPTFYSPVIEISNISETIIILVVSLKSNSEMTHEHYRMCAVRYILHECRKRPIIWRPLHTCLACSCGCMFTCPTCKEICRNP